MAALPFEPVGEGPNQHNWDLLAQQFPLGGQHIRQVPQARVFNTANLATATATPFAVTFDSERWDLGTASGQHSTASNTSRLTCVVAGLYAITGHVEWAANVTGYRLIRLRLNGNNAQIVAEELDQAVTVAAIPHRMSVATEYRLVVGDYVELIGEQSSGGNLNIVASARYSPEFAFAWLSP